MISVRSHKRLEAAADALGESYETIRGHFARSFPNDTVWRPDVEGYAVVFEASDAAHMFPCAGGDYDLLDPTSWEEVQLLDGRVFAAYVVLNNEKCSIAYVPNETWVPAILLDMLKTFI